MKKSILSQILELSHRLSAAAFVAWMRENEEVIIEQERAQIAEAWREGNREGWGMTSDDPLDGERYYDETFNAPERI